MIEKIAQLSDIHIRKTISRHDEYQIVFNNLYKSLKEKKPDRIVIDGDIVNDYLDLQTEQLILVSNFLYKTELKITFLSKFLLSASG